MPLYRLTHTHEAAECSVAYASWKGSDSPLRGKAAVTSCLSGRHEVWWDVAADSAELALARLPRFVAERTVAARVGDVVIQ